MMVASPPKTVCICEPQPLTALGLQALLSNSQDLAYGDWVDSLPDAGRMAKLMSPAVLLIDKGFGLHAVLEWIGEIKRLALPTQIVVWGITLTEPEALRLLQAGARGLLRKTADTAAVLSCLRSVASGSTWMESTVLQTPHRRDRHFTLQLTSREQQVLHLVEQGLKNREIARELGIRPGTVKIHLKHIFEKTGVRGRYGLALSGLSERASPKVLAS